MRTTARRTPAALWSSLPPCFSVLRSLSAAQANSAPRWYKDVVVIPNATEGEFLIQLDRRTLRTPARQLLAVPSYTLALAIAAEWQRQDSRLQPFTMPLMSLAATSIDAPRPRQSLIEAMLRHVHTDAVTCLHDRSDIAERQLQHLAPVMAWSAAFFGVAWSASDSIFGAEQPDEVVEALHSYLTGLSTWQLTALDALASACKSILLGAAVFNGIIGVHEAVSLARLEENLQLEEWGYVEGGHDIDEADIRVRIAAASVFTRLLSHATPAK